MASCVTFLPASSRTSPVDWSTTSSDEMRCSRLFHRRRTDLDRLERVENLQDVRVGLDAARAKEDCRLELLLAVDADVEDVVEVEFELDPGAAVGDDLGEEELLSEGGDLLLVVLLENDARRAVKLGHDDALGAVDDEGRRLRHDRHFAQHDFLLDDLLELAGRLAGREAEDGLQGAVPRRVVVLRLLGRRVARVAELVAHEVEDHRAVGGLDREHVEESGLEPEKLALLRLDSELHEVAERIRLHLQQRRKGHRLRDLAELDLFHARSPRLVSSSLLTIPDKKTARTAPPFEGAVSPYDLPRKRHYLSSTVGTRLDELLLHLFGLRLGDAFLHGLRGGLDENPWLPSSPGPSARGRP